MSGLVRKVVNWFVPVAESTETSDYRKLVFDYDSSIESMVNSNPQYQTMLEEKIKANEFKYNRFVTAGKWIDSLDKLGIFMGGEEPVEQLLKIPYALYYAYETKDYGALLYWGIHEVFSMIPVIGELADVRNIYVNRAKERMVKSIAKDFRAGVKTASLEQRIQTDPMADKYQRNVSQYDRNRFDDYINQLMGRSGGFQPALNPV
jgi:hypothetical protein